MRDKVYTSSVCNIPPCEKLRNVLYVELQNRCPKKCNYCKSYQGIPFKNHALSAVENNTDIVLNVLENRFSVIHGSSDAEAIDRVYLGGSDILLYPYDDLKCAVKNIQTKLHEKNNKIRKISGYTTIKSLKQMSKKKLSDLNNLGINVLYIGVESGSTNVLNLANKGDTKEDIISVADKLRDLDFMLSVNIMPGLGNIQYYYEHIVDSVDVLVELAPKWITFLSLDPTETKYDEIVREEDNRYLTSDELVSQARAILSGLEEKFRSDSPCLVAAYSNEVTSICDNNFIFRSHIGGNKND